MNSRVGALSLGVMAEVPDWSHDDRDRGSQELKPISKLAPNEAAFLRTVEDGDLEQVKGILQSGDVDVNCTGYRKRIPVTALQLAATRNDFRMVKLLLESGARHLGSPSQPDGEDEDVSEDVARYNQCRAISSPAYLSLAYSDPVEEAIELTELFHQLSECREIADTSKHQYEELIQRIRSFIVDLLGCCDTSEEVMTLLNGRKETACDVDVGQSDDHEHSLTLLRKALDAGEKEFVAHQHCQKAVKRVWLQGQPTWHTRNGVNWTILYALYAFAVYVLALPIICLVYIVAPCSPVARLLDNPKAKFLSHASSYFLFLLFILVEDTVLHSDPHEDLHTVKEIILCCLLFYFLSFAWLEVVQLYTVGTRKYFYDVKNVIDIFCLATFTTGAVVHLVDEISHVNIFVKIFWDTATSLSLVLVCLRFLRFLYLSQFLGPLLILMVAVAEDVFRFFIIYIYSVASFTFGFYYLYFEIVDSGYFSSFGKIVQSLLTVVFGADPSSSLSVHVTYNTTSGEVHDVSVVFEVIGVTLYVLFGTIIMIVLLNISIAMMSDTYSRMKNNIDVEWKFIRTQMWLEYMDHPVLPPPFNILPSVPCFMFIFEKCRQRKKPGKVNLEKQANNTNDEKEFGLSVKGSCKYDMLMRALLHRYTLEKEVIAEGDEEIFSSNCKSSMSDYNKNNGIDVATVNNGKVRVNSSLSLVSS